MNTIPGICSRSMLSGSLAWANHSTCNFSVAYLCTMVPLGAFACQRAWASPLGHWTAFLHTTINVSRIAFAIRKRTKNMASISIRVRICVALFSAVTNCLPPTPYNTPCVAPCKKAEFCVHRRYAVGGVCEQRIMALRIYIYIYIYRL